MKRNRKESVPEELERSARQRGRVERETRQSANSRESNRDSNKLQKELEKQLVDDLYNVRTEIDREKENNFLELKIMQELLSMIKIYLNVPNAID